LKKGYISQYSQKNFRKTPAEAPIIPRDQSTVEFALSPSRSIEEEVKVEVAENHPEKTYEKYLSLLKTCQQNLEQITGIPTPPQNSQIQTDTLTLLEVNLSTLNHYIASTLSHSFALRLPTDQIEARFEKTEPLALSSANLLQVFQKDYLLSGQEIQDMKGQMKVHLLLGRDMSDRGKPIY